MIERAYKIVAENGNKRLLMIEPEIEEDYLVVGATEEEVKENFPDYKPGRLDFFLNKYLIEENDVIQTKGPDGADITKELYGDNVSNKN